MPQTHPSPLPLQTTSNVLIPSSEEYSQVASYYSLDPSISPPRFERSDLQMVKMPGTANNSYKETVWTEHLKSMLYEHQNLYEDPISSLL